MRASYACTRCRCRWRPACSAMCSGLAAVSAVRWGHRGRGLRVGKAQHHGVSTDGVTANFMCFDRDFWGTPVNLL